MNFQLYNLSTLQTFNFMNFQLYKLSLIIPSFNEEDHIAACLNSIFSQKTELSYEVILSDNNSTDKTLEIAANYDINIVTRGGLPAEGRNRGAEAATGDYLLFLDADSILSPEFFNIAYEKMSDNKLDVASFSFKPRPYDLLSSITFWSYGLIGKILSVIPTKIFITSGCAIMVKRSVHEKLNGYNTDMIVLEEYDYVHRIRKAGGTFRVLPFPFVYTSTRRFKNGRSIKEIIRLFRFYFIWLFFNKNPKDASSYWKSDLWATS